MMKKLLCLLLVCASAYAQYVIPTAGPWTYNNPYVLPTVATPTFTPNGGSTANPVTVYITDATAGATIYYTTNGQQPTILSSVYSAGAGVLVSATGYLKAFATATGYQNSAVQSVYYTINSSIPTEASGVGYTVNTFASNSFSTSNVDMSNTQGSGFQWYIFNLETPGPSSGDYKLPGNNTISLAGPTGAQIATAAKSSNSSSFVGTAFGGGAYYEIQATQPNASSIVSSNQGWPVMWELTLEGSAIYGNAHCPLTGAQYSSSYPCPQWLGQVSGFSHQLESDWFENNFGRVGPALHESFGVYNSTCIVGSVKYCQNITNLPSEPLSTTLPTLHKYGVLWVPATSTSNGYEQFYFDDVLQSCTTPVTCFPSWVKFTNNSVSPQIPTNLSDYCGGTSGSTSCGTPNWGYGVIDILHQIPILGAGTGSNGPMVVYAFNVWQKDGSQNLTSGEEAVATPVISPGSESYSSSVTVTITVPAPNTGATIYYTTNGAAATTLNGTTLANGGSFTVSGGTETINAIAVQSGYAQSANATPQTYTYTGGSGGATQVFSYPSGFANGNLSLGGSSRLLGSVLQIPYTTTQHAAGGAGYTSKVDIRTFTTDFTFQPQYIVPSGISESITCFTIAFQNTGAPFPSQANNSGDSNMCGCGAYTTQAGTSQHPLNTSVCLKFEVNPHDETNFDWHDGLLPNSVGLYTGGGPYAAEIPQDNVERYGINFNGTDTFKAHLVYDGTILTMVLQDTNTGAQYRKTWPINIPAVVGANTSWIEFTGGTVQGPPTPYPVFNISQWDYFTGYATRNAPPVPSVLPNSYTTAQTVTFTPPSGTGGAVYYTTNGQDPVVTAAEKYTGPISITSNTILKAIAYLPGNTDSLIFQGNYTIGSAGTPVINYPSGFATIGGVSLVGSAYVSGSSIYLTTANSGVYSSFVGAAWWGTPVPVSTFTEHFQFNVNGSTDGFTWTLQNQPTGVTGQSWVSGGKDSIAEGGQGLGYGGNTGYAGQNVALLSAVALGFDVYTNQIGLAINGEQIPGSNLNSSGGFTPGSISLGSGHNINAVVTYNGTVLNLSLTDASTGATFNNSWTVNIPSLVGGSTAYDGFTGATGGANATQAINSWTHSSP